MAHREGHFDSTTFKRLEDKFKEDKSSGKYDLNYKSDSSDRFSNLPTFSFRGKNAYNEVVGNTPSAPYIKDQGTNKKFPYLSSKHHVGSVFNPMESSIRDKDAMTIAEERKATQDRMLEGDFAEVTQGTRGSSYFGDNFNKLSEKQAKIAVARHEYLTNAASQGEEALYNALNTERMVPNKKGTMIKADRLVNELFPIGKTSTRNTSDGSYAASPGGQSLKNINNFTDLSNAAIVAQDKSDYYREYFGGLANKPLVNNYFDTRGGE